MLNKIEGARDELTPIDPMPPQAHSVRLAPERNPYPPCRAETPSGDPHARGNLGGDVASDVADGLTSGDALVVSAVGDIIVHHRRYEDLRRAHQRLDLQVKAIKRFAGEGAPVEAWLEPYHAAMVPLASAADAEAKYLSKMAKRLPVAGWAEGISGLSDRFLALVIGEAGRPINDYRSPAALWKRMGMAVIDGGRQRRVTGDAALIHGYVPRRRALMWNIGESILKQQIRKNEAGERYAIGDYGQVYIDRRAYEAEKNGEKYSHARAKRYMEKRLLRELWKAWRDGCEPFGKRE